MGALDDHNRQHTHGHSLGPPTSVVGVSAQQAIDANRRLLEQSPRAASSGRPLGGRDHLKMGLGALVVCAGFALAAYLVGGFGAVALGLVAVIAAMFAVVFLIGALVGAAKAGTSRAGAGRRTPPGP